jgi:hypothetical protein
MSLVVRNLAFSVLVPGAGGIYVPWLILTRRDTALRPAAWHAVAAIAAGVALYLWCVWGGAWTP